MANASMEEPERVTRGYQQEMLDESLRSNIIIALDTGAGKTHIALLRMKLEAEREAKKVSWFLAPTVTLCEQQRAVIEASLPVSVGYISGAMEPTQWKNSVLWQKMLQTHRIMVSTPQVLLDALRHGYIIMGRDINLIVFDEAHHATKHNPYNDIMREFYFCLPKRTLELAESRLVRPMIMGLTASPIYGGDAAVAFRIIESNLDSTIRAPVIHRAELANFVHRPVFNHLTYPDHEPGFSTNLATLEALANNLDIEKDPYVISLRQALETAKRDSPEWRRLDQKLSKALNRRDTFVYKGMRDLCQAGRYLLETLGTWSADWFVYTAIEQARKAANPYNNMISSWKSAEKNHLMKILNKVHPTVVSFFEEDLLDELAPKVTALIKCLLHQKTEAESRNEAYSGIIFVERRYAVLALLELLTYHPLTKDLFRIGCLLGQSDNSRRHSLLDVTRYICKENQKDTLRDFRSGDKNLLVCTSVAEEGIDIQACGSVIRWDPPPNMASWAQSRGRARRRRSTYTLMFSEGGNGRDVVAKWEQLERTMIQLYNDPSRMPLVKDDSDNDGGEDVRLEFRLESGALLTLHSAIPHLAHFCSVIPITSHVDTRPLYDIYPPDMPEGWHSQNTVNGTVQAPSGPPYGSTVTLPKCLPIPVRVFSVPQVYLSKISAHRHAAFKAYRTLYEYKLLNENLLPITSVTEPRLEEEVKALLRDVEKRSSMENVTLQMNPWLPDNEVEGDADKTDVWWCSTLTIEDLHNFYFYTRREPVEWLEDEVPVLHHPIKGPIRVYLTNSQQVSEEAELIKAAREYTRHLFWCFNGSRLKWDQLDFAYLLLPIEGDSTWRERYEDAMNCEEHVKLTPEDEISVRADVFGSIFGYPDDITVVRKGLTYGKPYGFVRWRTEDEPLTEEEEEELCRFYGDRDGDLDIIYPLIVAQALPRRTNFLIQIDAGEESEEPRPVKSHILIAERSRIYLLSPNELDCAFLMPSILRAVAMSTVISSFSKKVLADSPLSEIPITALMPALTAPMAGESDNYQRLETLGDTVLKFIASIQILAEFPNWHEGYLTRKKDHTVSNGRLAKENIARGLYRWIIRGWL
ncbi:hypothetical protein AX15_003737 [Amanita polypyramis BW_CC]|nr:hypothetical protein AX15_003737 [Amanita polypyramis BW_CC]